MNSCDTLAAKERMYWLLLQRRGHAGQGLGSSPSSATTGRATGHRARPLADGARLRHQRAHRAGQERRRQPATTTDTTASSTSAVRAANPAVRVEGLGERHRRARHAPPRRQPSPSSTGKATDTRTPVSRLSDTSAASGRRRRAGARARPSSPRSARPTSSRCARLRPIFGAAGRHHHPLCIHHAHPGQRDWRWPPRASVSAAAGRHRDRARARAPGPAEVRPAGASHRRRDPSEGRMGRAAVPPAPAQRPARGPA